MTNEKKELSVTLKNMTLGEFINLVNENKKNDELKNINFISNREETILYTVNELIEKYPFFTRYNINKAIERDGLPYFLIGNKRMFNKAEIDKWFERETKYKKEKNKFEI